MTTTYYRRNTVPTSSKAESGCLWLTILYILFSAVVSIATGIGVILGVIWLAQQVF